MKVKKRTNDLVVQELEGEVLIYDLNSDKAFCLNRTSALIWDLCDGETTQAEIANVLAEGDIPHANESIVRLAVHQLWKEGLVTASEDENGWLSRMNRRELARRAGLTAAAVLPVISSLIMPTAAAAQSGSCGPSAGSACSCSGKITPGVATTCASSGCFGGGCTCSRPTFGWTGCNPGGHFCQGICA